MKSVHFAYAVFLILLTAVLINSLSIGRIMNSIENEVRLAEENDMERAEKEYTEIYDKYRKFELYISLSVDHDDLSDIESSFAEIIGAARAEDKGSVITIKSRLCDNLRHIRRLAGINLHSIF